MATASSVPPNLDPAWFCLSMLRQRDFDRCITACTELLEKNPYDQCVWYIKCRALTMKNWIDDTEMEVPLQPLTISHNPKHFSHSPQQSVCLAAAQWTSLNTLATLKRLPLPSSR